MKKSVLFFTIILSATIAFGQNAGSSSTQTQKPMVYMVSNAHFDTQWRWTVRTSIDEYLPSTLIQNFALFEKYPDYVFNFEGGVKYAWAKEYYPELFEKLKTYVASGQWHISGASWDATDPNMPSIESSIRNIMLGQRFYREEFGILSTDIMLPDCFGFGYQLPSVAAHCGLIGFGTQKLGWRKKPFYADGMKVPFHFGIWKGLDGNRVMAAMDGGGYAWSPAEPVTDWPAFRKVFGYFSDIPAIYRYFGTGDRGGSPTPTGMKYIAEAMANPGPAYDLRFAASDDMFKDYLWDSRLQEFDGELLMDVHATGCYTSKAEMKNLNRRNEWMLGSAETVSLMSDRLGGIAYPSYMIDNGWKRIIWHQFHDDLTGTSIPEAYLYSYNDEYITLRQMRSVIESAVASVAGVMDTRARGKAVMVYNPISSVNSSVAEAEIELPAGIRSVNVIGPDGRKVRSQIIARSGDRATVAFAGKNPSLSLSVYDFRPSANAEESSSKLKAEGNVLENAVYRITFDANGDMCSVIDKRCGRELVKEGCAFGLEFFGDNVSEEWPSWEIMREVMERTPGKVGGEVKLTVEECGPLRACMRVDRKHAGSTFTQKIYLTDGAVDDRIDVVNTVDWRSGASLLKASFPVSFDAPEASYDMGMGHISRGNNTDIQYEVFAHQWADVTSTDGKYGVTVMNDSKYGWDKPDDHTLRLTLLHTPGVGKGYTEQSTQDMGVHTFTYSIVGHPAALDPAKADIDSDCINQAQMAFGTDSHKGAIGKVYSIASTTTPDLRIKAFKKAQDGDGIVIRVYEMTGKGSEGQVVFNSPIVSAEELNGIEDSKGPATFRGNALDVKSSGFALKTYRVRLAEPGVSIPSREYTSVSLPFDIVGITSDIFTTQGKLGGDHRSFAAEILPERIEYRGVPFVFGKADYRNAVRCNGQTIALPENTRTLHLLVAADYKGEEVEAQFAVGAGTYSFKVSDFAGFYGVYGWPGYYESSLRTDELAYVGTHTHRDAAGNDSYLFTYMYMIDVPVDGAGEIKLPEGGRLVLFSATAEK